MVGASIKPSCGRNNAPIHSILYSVAHDLGEGHYKLLLYNTRNRVYERNFYVSICVCKVLTSVRGCVKIQTIYNRRDRYYQCGYV